MYENDDNIIMFIKGHENQKHTLKPYTNKIIFYWMENV